MKVAITNLMDSFGLFVTEVARRCAKQ